MLAYAANDVRYLLPLTEIFKERLHARGRWEWFLQSCDAGRRQVLNRKEKSRDDLWRISGWGRMSRRELAYLREIWHWRDEIAARRDKPPFKVLSNDQMISMSTQLASGKKFSLPPRFREHHRERFAKAIKSARELPEEALPKWERRKRVAKASDWEAVFQGLRERRDRSAKEHNLEASFIASKASLERYAYAQEPDREVLKGELFLPWQQGLLFPGESSPVH